MNTFRFETTIQETGTLTLQGLPFKAGQVIEIVIVERPPPPPVSCSYALRGTPYQYLDPTAPVAESDWEATQ